MTFKGSLQSELLCDSMIKKKRKKSALFGDRKCVPTTPQIKLSVSAKADLDHDQSKILPLLQHVCYPVTDSQAG